MKADRQLAALVLTCSLLITLPADASDTPELENNPFARPPSERSARRPAVSTNPDGSIEELDLRATMVGTRDQLANVGGRVLRAGDEVQGYTLLKVYEDRAVFGRQGKQQTVYVKPDSVESDD